MPLVEILRPWCNCRCSHWVDIPEKSVLALTVLIGLILCFCVRFRLGKSTCWKQLKASKGSIRRLFLRLRCYCLWLFFYEFLDSSAGISDTATQLHELEFALLAHRVDGLFTAVEQVGCFSLSQQQRGGLKNSSHHDFSQCFACLRFQWLWISHSLRANIEADSKKKISAFGLSDRLSF